MSDRVVEVPCRYCDGDGREPSTMVRDTLSILVYNNSPCSVCRGRGMLRFQIPDTPTNCGTCQGTGREDWIQNMMMSCYVKKCRSCGGFGILSLTGKIRKLS